VGQTCATDCDCGNGLGCVQGICERVGRINHCCTSAFCPPGAECVEPSGMTSMCPSQCSVPVGDACAQGSMDCQGGFCISEQMASPAVHCTAPGAWRARSGRRGPRCPNVGGMGGMGGPTICLANCNSTIACRMGYTCTGLGTTAQRVCLPIPAGSTNPN